MNNILSIMMQPPTLGIQQYTFSQYQYHVKQYSSIALSTNSTDNMFRYVETTSYYSQSKLMILVQVVFMKADFQFIFLFFTASVRSWKHGPSLIPGVLEIKYENKHKMISVSTVFLDEEHFLDRHYHYLDHPVYGPYGQVQVFLPTAEDWCINSNPQFAGNYT